MAFGLKFVAFPNILDMLSAAELQRRPRSMHHIKTDDEFKKAVAFMGSQVSYIDDCLTNARNMDMEEVGKAKKDRARRQTKA